MRGLKKLLALILISATPFIQNCGPDIDETNAFFKWVEKGNSLTYDLKIRESKISNYRVLDIIEDPGIKDNLIFIETIPTISNDPFEYELLLNIFTDVYRVKDGLHTTTCSSCTANPCLSVKDYLKVPLRPVKYQSIPDYLCADQTSTYDTVISTDSVIIVPLGRFKTFVIHDTFNRSIKFWNEEAGLIRVDNYNASYPDTVTLELSKRNY